MKTKNTRVRIKDIKHGRIIYRACPFYLGVSKLIVASKPYHVKGIGLFFDCINSVESGYLSEHSIDDCGINQGDSYNDKKTFFKEKQALDYINKIRHDKRALTRNSDRLSKCNQYYDYED